MDSVDVAARLLPFGGCSVRTGISHPFIASGCGADGWHPQPDDDHYWSCAVNTKVKLRWNTDSNPRYGNGCALNTAASIER